jgi:hypothetical protein
VPLGHRTVAVTIEERADCRGDKQCHLSDRRTRRSKRPGDQVIFGADPLLAIESLEASHCKWPRANTRAILQSFLRLLEITFKNGPFETGGHWAGSANRAAVRNSVGRTSSIVSITSGV